MYNLRPFINQQINYQNILLNKNLMKKINIGDQRFKLNKI